MPTPSFLAGQAYAVDPGTHSYNNLYGGANVALIVDVLGRTNPSGVTYNGVAMTLAAGPQVGAEPFYLESYYLLNPPVGTYNIVVSGAGDGAVHARTYKNVKSSSPIGNTGGAGNFGQTVTPEVTIASEATELVVCASMHEGRGTNNMGPASGQTERLESGSGAGDAGLMTGDEAGAASVVTGSWNNPQSTINADGLTIAYGLKYGASGGGPRWFLFRRFMDDLKRGLVPPDTLRRRYRDLVSI